MAKVQREPPNDADVMLDGENLTAEQLDHASVEMLQNYTDFGRLWPRSSWRGGKIASHGVPVSKGWGCP
jgi:hypothetical protein